MNNNELGTIDEKLRLADSFNKQIANIFRVIESKIQKNADMVRLKNIIGGVRGGWPLFMIERCKDKLWKDSKSIINRDEKYFINRSFDEYIKKDENQKYIENIIDIIQSQYSELNKNEKNCIWKYIEQMLSDSIKFKILTKS